MEAKAGGSEAFRDPLAEPDVGDRLCSGDRGGNLTHDVEGVHTAAGPRAIMRMNHENGGFDCPGCAPGTCRS
jgi:hypothetical protein